MNILNGLAKAQEIALNSTFKSKTGRLIRIGAVLYNGNGFISSNVNQNKTHPLMLYYNQEMPYNKIPYLHAEVAALLTARWNIGKENLKDCTIYVARKLNKEGWGNARPCPACMKALLDAGIKQVIYTTDNGHCLEWIS
jgi:Cytosine/adenosine deaminases